MLWILHTLYFGQHGEVTGLRGNSRNFQINAGVRQGCVLSPRMFSAVLHWAMSKWRTWAEGYSFGFDFGDGLPPLLDLRFADDILVFARSSQGIMTFLDKLVQFLGDAGLKLNAAKTGLITTEAQPPPCLTTSTGAVISVKEKASGHKWLGCMLSSAGSKSAVVDIDYHLQSANRAFFATEPKCVHQKQTEISRCHRDTNCLFWSWAPVHPYCRCGQIWYPLPTYDPMRGWSSKRDLHAGSMVRNSAYLESACARNG